jgi:aminoglycoside phosphotransferase (APT) family kinase protein
VLTEHVNLADGLSGRGGLEGVQCLLRGRSARQLLRRELAALLEHPHTPGPCRLRRAKFKPGRKLTAYYDLQLHDLEGARRGSRPIAVSWTPADDIRRGSARAIAELQAEVARRGLAAPFHTLEGEHPGWGMRMLVFPLDERFPQLIRLSDPGYLPDRLPGAGRVLSVTPLRYRPGQRHVLRYELRSPFGAETPDCVYAKLYEGDDGRESHDVAMRLADWVAASGDGLAAAMPLAYLDDDRAVLYRRVAGRPLSEFIRRERAGAALHLRRAGSLLRVLHAAPARLAGSLSRHDLTAEARAIARAGEHVDALLPTIGARIHEILEQAQAAYVGLAGEAPTFTHGDFKADHLFVAPGRLTVIDFDRCRLDDPACDLGKVLADLRWWYGAGDLERAQQAFLTGYGQDVSAPRLERARVYESMLLVKIAARRVRLFDADWGARMAALVERAEALLTGIQRPSATRRGAAEPRRAALGSAAIRRSSSSGSADLRS